jgi:hypothetical protein
MTDAFVCSRCRPGTGCRTVYGQGNDVVSAHRIGRRINAGESTERILTDHPSLTVHDLRDAVERFLDCPVASSAPPARPPETPTAAAEEPAVAMPRAGAK